MTERIRSLGDAFRVPTTDPRSVSALQLAFIGDAVIEVASRTIAVSFGDRKIRELHLDSIDRENAKTESAMVDVLEPVFTEEERSVYHRGRNAEVATKAKNASINEYHRATGLEAVIGYLYLCGRYERLTELLKTGWEACGAIK